MPRADAAPAARRSVLALLACLLLPAAALAQSFPNKPLRLIVRAAPGGTDDLIARLVAPAVGKTLGQQMIVDYRPGAGGLVAWEYASKQPPDGYTVLLAASGLAAIKSLRPDMPIDAFRDFTWVSQVTSFMLVLTAHPSLPARNIRELVALARSRPGQLSYGSSGVGATPHLAAEYFKSVAKIQINHVPYKGAGPMYLDLMGGRIELGSAVVGGAMQHIRNGRIRGLGVSGAKRSPELPDLPTILESGYPGFVFEPFYALVLPAKASREIAGTLSDAVAKAMTTPEFREQFNRIVGSEVVVNRPEQMLQVARQEAELIDRIVREAGIKAE
jgi:tripartite-type tricarboxylate transporter receptor subunit TctC